MGRKKTGHASSSEQLDVMYNANIDTVKPRPQSAVDIAHQQKRDTLAGDKPEGAEVMYDWTRWVDQKKVQSPNIKLVPDREARKKQGFGSASDPKVDVMYDHNKMQKSLARRP